MGWGCGRARLVLPGERGVQLVCGHAHVRLGALAAVGGRCGDPRVVGAAGRPLVRPCPLALPQAPHVLAGWRGERWVGVAWQPGGALPLPVRCFLSPHTLAGDPPVRRLHCVRALLLLLTRCVTVKVPWLLVRQRVQCRTCKLGGGGGAGGGTGGQGEAQVGAASEVGRWCYRGITRGARCRVQGVGTRRALEY